MSQTQYFLGANSPSGFYSLYHELSDPDRMERLYILKGGPGCGKSTLMKRIARHAEVAGLDTQLILCSGDPDSLDGVILPQKQIAVVDGTAPHVVEANCPGALEEYLDLSHFYDAAALRPLRDDLLTVTKEYKNHYQQAYRCLGASGELRQNLAEEADCPEIRRKLEKRAKGIISRELKLSGDHVGRVDYRFLTAVTHKGKIQLWDTVSAQADKVYALSDSHGLAHYLLSPILNAARATGHNVVACLDPMAPDRLAHLILPDLSLAFVTSAGDDAWEHHTYRRLRLDSMAESCLKEQNRPRQRFTRKISDALLDEGIGYLRCAKEAHDRLEAIYNPHVDFEGVCRVADDLASQIINP